MLSSLDESTGGSLLMAPSGSVVVSDDGGGPSPTSSSVDVSRTFSCSLSMCREHSPPERNSDERVRELELTEKPAEGGREGGSE